MKIIFIVLCFLLFSLSGFAKQGQRVDTSIAHPSGHFDPEKAAIQLISTIPAAERAKADSYTEGNYWLLLWNEVCSGVVAWIFISLGLSVYLLKRFDWIKKENRRNLVFIVLYLLLTFIISLPLDIYQNFVREHQYGLSNQSFMQWLVDDIVKLTVEIVIGAPFLVLAFTVFRKVKDRWWTWGAGVSVVLVVFLVIIYPVFITPLFNNYKPIKEGPLKESLLSMARANQVDIDQVYVYNESEQTKEFNANVSGVAGTARISLNDNMLNHCTNAEIKAVVGHEMGHYVLNHLFILTLEFSILIIAGFRVAQWTVNWLIGNFGERWKIKNVADIASLPLLVFLFTAYFFVLSPVSNSIIRTVESQADNYGLNAARQPDAFASVMLKTAEYNKIDPGYWEEILFFDHPCRKKRILAAMTWKNENQ